MRLLAHYRVQQTQQLLVVGDRQQSVVGLVQQVLVENVCRFPLPAWGENVIK